MRLQKEVYSVYKDHINKHFEENRNGALLIKSALENSPLNCSGVLDKTVHIPKIFDDTDVEQFHIITDITYRIFCKVINEYRKHEDYRRLFPFSRELEVLIMLPQQCDSCLPIMRMDIFYNEDTGDFQFCEINTDGTAAMLRDYEIRKAFADNPAHQYVIRQFDLNPFELFDSWTDTFMSLYDSYPGKINDPNVAIVDFLENATINEFYEFQDRFIKKGINCEICDIRSLKYDNGSIYSDKGNRIDAIYRRAVTADIMAHYDEVSDFLNAVRNDDVFIAGTFCTQVIHTKWLFYVLHHPRTKDFLTGEELEFVKRHVPYTVEFSKDYISLEEVISNKDMYILKPMDAYASKGVYAAGREYTDKEWKETAEELYEKGYICQQYCTQYMTDNIDFAWGDGKWHPYINMPGLYVYNGRFTGILMRTACEENIITAHDNERTQAVFTVKGKL